MIAYFHRRHTHRIAKMKAEQERIESELRIARDIQMSMVPSTFPDYEGLDMFASMMPVFSQCAISKRGEVAKMR